MKLIESIGVGVFFASTLLGLGAATAGCEEANDAAPLPTVPDTGQGGDGTSVGVGGFGTVAPSMHFVVVKGGTWEVIQQPLAGATVVLETPEGDRREQTSGRDGRVTFLKADFSAGRYSATAYLRGYALYSLVDFDEEAADQLDLVRGAIPLILEPTPQGEQLDSVTLQGQVTGKMDASHELVIGIVGQPDAAKLKGGVTEVVIPGAIKSGAVAFALNVVRGKPFVLQAYERELRAASGGQGFEAPIYQVAQKAYDGLFKDLTDVEFDLASNRMLTYEATVTMGLPSRADSPVRDGYPDVCIIPRNSAHCTGWATSADVFPTAIGVNPSILRLEAKLLWVKPTWAEAPRIRTRMLDSRTTRLPVAGLDNLGYPRPGTTHLGMLLDSPSWRVHGEDVSEPRPVAGPLELGVHSTLSWHLFDEGINDTTVAIKSDDYDHTYWIAMPAPGRTSISLPAAPSKLIDDALARIPVRVELTVGRMNWNRHEWRTYSVAPRLAIKP